MGESPALEGVTVLEATTGLPGATCGRLLAMLGADVIKIESVARPDEARTAGTGVDRFVHAQKRSVALDVRTPEGSAIFTALAANADVVLDDGELGAPPEVRGRHDELLAANPRLVVAAFSAYGLDGPRAGWQSTELTELAAGGWLAHGPNGGAPLMPGSSSPRSGAGTFGALGVVLALTARRTTGRGQLVEVCLNETYLHLLTLPTVVAMYTGMDMPRMGDGYPYGIYRCADGYLGVSILTQPQWLGLCRLMDRADLADHPRFRTGVERADPAVAAELDAIITAWIAEQPAEDDVPRGAGDARADRRSCRRRPRCSRRRSTRHATTGSRSTTTSSANCGSPRPRSELASGALAPFRPAPRSGADTAAILGAGS